MARIVHLFPGSRTRLWAEVWIGLLGGLLDRAHSIHLRVGYRMEKESQPGLQRPGFDVEEIPFLAEPADPAYRLRIRLDMPKRLKKLAPDIVHVHFPELIVATAHLRRSVKSAALVYSPAIDPDWVSGGGTGGIVLRRGFKRAAARADRVIVRGHAEENALLDAGLVRRYQTSTVPLALDPVRVKRQEPEESRREIGLPDSEKLVGLYAPGAEISRIQELLINLNPLLQENPQLSLLLVLARERLNVLTGFLRRFPNASRVYTFCDIGRWDRIVRHLVAAVVPGHGLHSELGALYCRGAGVPYLDSEALREHGSGRERGGRFIPLSEIITRLVLDGGLGSRSEPSGNWRESVASLERAYAEVLDDRRIRETQ